MRRTPLSLIAGITVLGSAAHAEVINEGRIGLADPVKIITFDELGIADDTRVSAEFAHLGVTFLPELYLRTGDHPDWDNITGPNLRSGNLAGDILHRTFSLRFDPPLSSAAFVAIAQPPTPTTFTARFKGVEIESFDATVVIGNANNFFGFTDIIFDEIEVSYTADTRMRIDNLQLGVAVDIDGPPLDVNSSGDTLIFTWESQSGKLYTLRSEIDPATAEPKNWPVYDGNSDLPATPPENTLTLSRPADPFRLFVIEEFDAPPVDIFADDFESGQGSWTTGPAEATATVWELGMPSQVGPTGSHGGVNCFGTDLDGTYADDAVVWLRSPAIDLTTAGGATLNFWQFKDIELSFDRGTINLLDAADDSLLVELQTDIDGLSPDWEQFSKKLPPEALGKVIKIEFLFTSDDFNTNPQAGWYIDDVAVTVP